jgi:DUF1680 family protein
VYCAEEADNGAPLHAMSLPRRAKLIARCVPALLGGAVVISGRGLRHLPGDGDLYLKQAPVARQAPFKLVPYALWGNRRQGAMQVWLSESA